MKFQTMVSYGDDLGEAIEEIWRKIYKDNEEVEINYQD